jgi:tetratricopeptide (TPR) repeat protein
MTNSELFEQYLDRKLADAETAGFEQRLREDAAFAREFEQYRLIQTDMQQWQETEKEREALKQTLKRVTGKNKDKARIRALSWYLWRAAVAIIIITPVLLMTLKTSGKSDSALYEEYVSGENISLTRGSNTDSLQEVLSGLFYDKKYAAAIDPLKQIINRSGDSLNEANIYLGYCYMQTAQYEQAKTIFTQNKIMPGIINDRAHWYLALLYLKLGQRVNCRVIIKQLADGDGEYSKKSAKLLKELR